MLRRGSGWSLPFLLCPSTEPLKGQAAQRRVYPEEPQAHTHTPSAINCNLIQQALPIICTRPGLHQKGKEKGERRERVSGDHSSAGVLSHWDPHPQGAPPRSKSPVEFKNSCLPLSKDELRALDIIPTLRKDTLLSSSFK